MQYIQVLESNLDSEGLYIYNIYCLGIRITPVIKTIKSTELQIHLFQVLPKLAACLYGLVFLILYYATVVLKFQIIPVDFFSSQSFFFFSFFLQQCFPGPPYPILFCSVGTSGPL